MTREQQKIEQLIQLNRHLKEWNDNVAYEVKTRYSLAGKHKYERDCLDLAEVTPGDRSHLVAQQLQESRQLKQHNNEARIVMEARHIQEKDLLR